MAYLASIEGVSELPGAPDWQQFLERSRDQLVTEIQTPEANPLDERVTASAVASLEALRVHGQHFVDTLTAWPELCEVAKNQLK